MQLSYSAWTLGRLWLDVGRIVSRIAREFHIATAKGEFERLV